jgi:Fe-S-cluster containining protein
MLTDDANSLCLECGLCCNGVIFADVQLQPGDNAAKLQALGLAFLKNRKFHQPCTAFAGCKCNIYSERPTYCREFECLLLKSVKAGEVKLSEARRIIRSTLKQAEKVKTLLRELGDADESLAPSKRFQRIQRTVERGPCDKKTAHTFGKLTLAVHELNLLLSHKFYSEG